MSTTAPTTESATQAHDRFHRQLTSQAWPLDKFPPRQRHDGWAVAPWEGTVLCPRHYGARVGGYVKKPFKKGDDLNALVFKVYDERVRNPSSYGGQNYVVPLVAEGLVQPKRHEYLGPSPHVASYRFCSSTHEVEIEWYEPFLGQTWVGARRWEVEVEWEEGVGEWRVVERGE